MRLGVVHSRSSQRRPPQARRTGLTAKSPHGVHTGIRRETRLQLTLTDRIRCVSSPRGPDASLFLVIPSGWGGHTVLASSHDSSAIKILNIFIFIWLCCCCPVLLLFVVLLLLLLSSSCRYLVHVVTMCPVAAGSRWAGSTGVPRILQAFHTEHALVAGVWRAARARLMETCRGTQQLRSGREA